MVHFHYLITCASQLDSTANIYLVAVGTGAQADRDYLFLLAYATENNFFLNIRTNDSTEFIQRIILAHGIPQSSIQRVKVRDLVRAIKAAQKMPLAQIHLSNGHAFRKSLSLNYRIFSALSNRA